MRQRCELCLAHASADATRGKFFGMAVGTRDVLLCAEHALFTLDADVDSLEELRELYAFVHDDPLWCGASAATVTSTRRHGGRTTPARPRHGNGDADAR